jgi:type III secretion protein V
MNPDSVISDHSSLTLVVELCDRLARHRHQSLWQREVEETVGNVLKAFGIPGSPRVEVTKALAAPLSAESILRMRLNGRDCPYPAELLSRVFAFVTGEEPGDPWQPDQMPVRLTEQPEQMSLFAQLLTSAIMQSRPAQLLSARALSSCREALIEEAGTNDLPDAETLRQMFTEVLRLGISLDNRKVIASVLQEAMKQKWSVETVSEELIAALLPEVIEIQIAPEYFRELTLHATADDRDVFSMMRDGLFYELGVRFPPIRFVPTPELASDSFRFRINHQTTLPWRGLRKEERLVNDTVERLSLLVRPPDARARAATNPANGNRCAIIAAEDVVKAKDAGLTTWTPLGFMVLALSGELRAHAGCFLDIRAAQTQIDQLKLYFPQLVAAALARYSPEQIARTQRLLLAEELPVRNLRHILQALVDFDFIEVDDSQYILFAPWLPTRVDPSPEWSRDPVALAAQARATMKNYITHKYTRGSWSLPVYLLDPKIEQWIVEHQPFAFDAEMADEVWDECELIRSAIREEVREIFLNTRPALLTTVSVRQSLREIIAPVIPAIPALCYQELAPDLNIQPIARISLDQ